MKEMWSCNMDLFLLFQSLQAEGSIYRIITSLSYVKCTGSREVQEDAHFCSKWVRAQTVFVQKNPEYLQWWRLHSLCWKWFVVFDYLHGKSMPCPSTPLPAALCNSISSVLIRTFNNIGPFIYPWGMLLITIQTSYWGSQETEPREEAIFRSHFHLSNSYITNFALRTPWETVKHLSWGIQHFPSCTQGQAEISLISHYLSQSLDSKSALDLCILCHLLLAWEQQETPESCMLPAWRGWCQNILLISWAACIQASSLSSRYWDGGSLLWSLSSVIMSIFPSL